MLVDTEKKSDARKEELQSKTKQCEKLENIINDLQNKVRMHLHRVGLTGRQDYYLKLALYNPLSPIISTYKFSKLIFIYFLKE